MSCLQAIEAEDLGPKFFLELHLQALGVPLYWPHQNWAKSNMIFLSVRDFLTLRIIRGNIYHV